MLRRYIALAPPELTRSLATRPPLGMRRLDARRSISGADKRRAGPRASEFPIF